MTNNLPADSEPGIPELIDLCEALERDAPMTRAQEAEIYERYKNVTRIDHFADQATQDAQLSRTIEFNARLNESPLRKDMALAWNRANKDDLAIHARNIRNQYEARKINGDVVAPGSAKRIAVILRARKRKDLEARFLLAWCRHFDPGGSKPAGELNIRLQKLS
jgi:hypothetical protein